MTHLTKCPQCKYLCEEDDKDVVQCDENASHRWHKSCLPSFHLSIISNAASYEEPWACPSCQNTVMRQCAICMNEEFTSSCSEAWITCCLCQIHYHLECMDEQRRRYAELQTLNNVPWKCMRCELVDA